MYVKSDDGCIYHDFYSLDISNGIYTVGLVLDTVRWFKFNSQGQQISDNPYYTLFFEDYYASI